MSTVQTSFETRFRAVEQYNVTAGVGPFNGSLVVPYISKQQRLQPNYLAKIMPYSTLAAVYNLIVNPMYSIVQQPVGCFGNNCSSYLMTGGLLLTTPWAPSRHYSSPMIILKDVPSRQFDFEQEILPNNFFQEEHCSTYSDNGMTIIAMKFCARHSPRVPGSLVAGRFL